MDIELIGMRTGEGKTITAMKKAYDVALSGVNTLLISTEMTQDDIIRRYKNQLGIEAFKGIQMFFVSTGCVDIDKVYELFKNKIAKNNIQYVIIDHLPVSPKQAIEFNKYKSVLNSLKEEFGINVLAYYQKSFNE